MLRQRYPSSRIHAEYLGITDFVRRSDSLCLANETCNRWHDMSKADKGYEVFLEMERDVTTDQVYEKGTVSITPFRQMCITGYRATVISAWEARWLIERVSN